MDRSELFVAAVVAIVVAVPVISGPVVGVVDLTTESMAGVGQGSATVDGVETPETGRFDRALSADHYVMEVPDARIHVAAIEGQPLVAYKISVPELGYSRGTTHFLSDDDTGWVTLSVRSETFAPERIERGSYEAELSLVLRVNGTEEVLHEGPITMEVTE